MQILLSKEEYEKLLKEKDFYKKEMEIAKEKLVDNCPNCSYSSAKTTSHIVQEAPNVFNCAICGKRI